MRQLFTYFYDVPERMLSLDYKLTYPEIFSHGSEAQFFIAEGMLWS